MNNIFNDLRLISLICKINSFILYSFMTILQKVDKKWLRVIQSNQVKLQYRTQSGLHGLNAT